MEFMMNVILSSVRMATPLIFLALAELYSQRAGLVHIGLEGLAAIGSLVGFLVSLITGSPALGVVAGAAVGILVNMIYAYATINLCAEQIVYGMAINIFAPALAAFIYRVYFGAGSELVQVGLMNSLASSLGVTPTSFIGYIPKGISHMVRSPSTSRSVPMEQATSAKPMHIKTASQKPFSGVLRVLITLISSIMLFTATSGI